MDKDQIYKDLTRLVDEIDQLPLEDSERRSLHKLVAEMESHVEAPEQTERPEDLTDTVDGLISRFETDHPSVTGVLRRVLNALTSIGV